ncbi:MAG: hypothetical protein LBI57_05420 [Helicobacteraceae bacterium]|jgi:hypothetical protein|nr:hypothetical protein [Helicobacteraceae bacterium]
MPRKKSPETGGEIINETQSDESAKQSSESDRTKTDCKRSAEFFAQAWDWIKTNAKKSLPHINKASDWAWDNAAAVLPIAAAAIIGGALGFIFALALFAVLSYYKAAKEQEKR